MNFQHFTNLFSEGRRGIHHGVDVGIPKASAHGPLHYRPEIDGLRAIAVSAVILFHAFPDWITGGFVGVDVFFVISGFLITSILIKQWAKGRFSYRDFYVRRARRILPALCLVLASCLVVGYFALLPEEFSNLGRHMAAAAAFAANLSLWQESGYFAPASEFQPLLHLWSLGIEEQFYLVWPVVLSLAWRRTWNVLPVIAILTLASFVLSVVLTRFDPTAAFYFPLSRFWELGIGCLLAVIKTRAAAVPAGMPARRGTAFTATRWKAYGPITGFALIAIALFVFDDHTPFPGFAALIPTLGAALVLAGDTPSWFQQRVLASRVAVFLGLISYPLYLWHWPILSFEAILHSGTPQPIYRVAAVLLSVCLATLTYRYLELPIRERRGNLIAIGLVGGAAVIGLFGATIVLRHGLPGRYPPTVAAMKQGPREDSACVASVSLQTEFNYCKRTRNDPPEILFLGDSQAQGVYDGATAALGSKRSMMLLGRGGCPPGLGVSSVDGVYESGHRRRICNQTWTTFVDYVRQVRPAVVVLVGDGARFFEPTSDDETRPVPDSNRKAFKRALNLLVTHLEPYSRVAYVSEIPTFETGPSCFLRRIKLPGSPCSHRISLGALVASRALYQQSVREVSAKHPNLLWVDPIPALCESNSCAQTSHGGSVLYSDKMHLSPAGGRRFTENSGFARLIDEAAARQQSRSGLM
jgi:peptidoglycan/LPS O-acetylase OafA/YrhL